MKEIKFSSLFRTSNRKSTPVATMNNPPFVVANFSKQRQSIMPKMASKPRPFLVTNSERFIGNIIGFPKPATPKKQMQWKTFSPLKKRVEPMVHLDFDRDGVPNRWDCKPFDSKEQDSRYFREVYLPQRGIKFKSGVKPREQRIMAKQIRKNPQWLGYVSPGRRLDIGTFEREGEHKRTLGQHGVSPLFGSGPQGRSEINISKPLLTQNYSPEFAERLKTARQRYGGLDDMSDQEILKRELRGLDKEQQLQSRGVIAETMGHEFTHEKQIQDLGHDIRKFNVSYDLAGPYRTNKFEVEARKNAVRFYEERVAAQKEKQEREQRDKFEFSKEGQRGAEKAFAPLGAEELVEPRGTNVGPYDPLDYQQQGVTASFAQKDSDDFVPTKEEEDDEEEVPEVDENYGKEMTFDDDEDDKK